MVLLIFPPCMFNVVFYIFIYSSPDEGIGLSRNALGIYPLTASDCVFCKHHLDECYIVLKL